MENRIVKKTVAEVTRGNTNVTIIVTETAKDTAGESVLCNCNKADKCTHKFKAVNPQFAGHNAEFYNVDEALNLQACIYCGLIYSEGEKIYD